MVKEAGLLHADAFLQVVAHVRQFAAGQDFIGALVRLGASSVPSVRRLGWILL
jgi:hypothetical protein